MALSAIWGCTKSWTAFGEVWELSLGKESSNQLRLDDLKYLEPWNLHASARCPPCTTTDFGWDPTRIDTFRPRSTIRSYLKPPRVDSTGKQIECPVDKCWLHLPPLAWFGVELKRKVGTGWDLQSGQLLDTCLFFFVSSPKDDMSTWKILEPGMELQTSTTTRPNLRSWDLTSCVHDCRNVRK